MKFSTDVLLSSDQWVPSQLKMIYPPPWVRPQMGTRHPHPILGADLTPAGAICGMDQTPLGVILSVYGWNTPRDASVSTNLEHKTGITKLQQQHATCSSHGVSLLIAAWMAGSLFAPRRCRPSLSTRYWVSRTCSTSTARPRPASRPGVPPTRRAFRTPSPPGTSSVPPTGSTCQVKDWFYDYLQVEWSSLSGRYKCNFKDSGFPCLEGFSVPSKLSGVHCLEGTSVPWWLSGVPCLESFVYCVWVLLPR